MTETGCFRSRKCRSADIGDLVAFVCLPARREKDGRHVAFGMGKPGMSSRLAGGLESTVDAVRARGSSTDRIRFSKREDQYLRLPYVENSMSRSAHSSRMASSRMQYKHANASGPQISPTGPPSTSSSPSSRKTFPSRKRLPTPRYPT